MGKTPKERVSPNMAYAEEILQPNALYNYCFPRSSTFKASAILPQQSEDATRCTAPSSNYFFCCRSAGLSSWRENSSQ
eukprot:2472666-Amphidinium_carterae.1